MTSSGVYGSIIPSCTTIYGSFVLSLGILTKPFELRENNTEIIRGIRRKTQVSWLLKDIGSYNS